MNTTASTYHGPPVTLEDLRRAVAWIETAPPPPPTDPIHLTRQEMDRLADAMGLVHPNTENAPSSLMGIPIVVVDENHPIARLFTWKQRIERTHPLLKGWKA